MVNSWKVPESLWPEYKGTGIAVAATLNGALVKFVYLNDIDEAFFMERYDEVRCMAIIADPRMGPTIRYLQSLGDVHAGMMSCYEFVDL